MSGKARGLEAVESRLFETACFGLESGVVLERLALAYETYGELATDGRNGVLITHGYTNSHHAAGTYAPGKAPQGLEEKAPGFWDKLIGPGKAIDTDRLFVVSSNMLGSAYGSTAPRSIDPATGRPYGPDFPRFTVGDIVRAQKLLLDHLGVRHLVAVAGNSYGGYQAFQWAVTFPDFMDGVVPVVTSPRSSVTPQTTKALIDDLAHDPNWNGGWYYDTGGIRGTMLRMRVATLKNYGIDAQLAPSFPDDRAREAEIERLASRWAEAFDGNSLVALRRALETFDTTGDFERIRARVLYVISRTDRLFPPAIVPDVMARLKAAGVDARYFEIDSEAGHLASGVDGEKWAPAFAEFMGQLQQKR